MQSNSNQQPQNNVYSNASMHQVLKSGIQSIFFRQNETQNRLVQSQPNILSINQEFQQERKKRRKNSKTPLKINNQLFNLNKSENFKTPKKSLSKNNRNKSKSNQNQIFNNLSNQKIFQHKSSTESSHQQSKLIVIRPNFPDKSRERADEYRQKNKDQSKFEQDYHYLEQTCTNKICMVFGNGLCIQHCRVDKEEYINEFLQRPYPFQIRLQYKISEQETVNSENYPSQLNNTDDYENMGNQQYEGQYLDSGNQIPDNNKIDQEANQRKRQQVQTDQQHQKDLDQNGQQSTNPFPLSMQFQQFKLRTDFHYFFSHDFVPPETLNYSTRYQFRHLWQYYGRNNNQGLIIKPMDKLSLLCLNCDFNIQGNRKRKMRKQYINTSEQRRARELVEIIKRAMNNRVDFILLQQICHVTMRFQLLQAIQQWNQAIQDDLHQKIYTDKCQYYYPDNLFKTDTQAKCMNFRTTMILTRHQVRFGQLKFYIPVSQRQQQQMVRLPIQAFCQFEIKIEGKQRYEKVCILSCHLRSNGATYSTTTPKELRRKQIQCFQHLSKNYDRFYCIGDTNIPSSEFFQNQNEQILKIFADATTSLRSQVRGTYLFLRDSQYISNERLDRVWMKKENQQSTAVQITYRDEELEACRGQGLNRLQLFAQYDNTLLYISPTDHTILDITIKFVK